MNAEQLHALLIHSGLARIANDLIAAARPAVRIHTRPAADQPLAVGVSKLGGLPDLPPGTDWPRWHRPLRFIGQFNLSSVTKFDREQLLPNHGLLSFFYESDGEPRYSERMAERLNRHPFSREEQQQSWRVLYIPDDPASFARTPQPADSGDVPYPERPIRYANALTLPDCDGPELHSLALTSAERSALIDLQMMINRGEFAEHQLLGYPFSLNGPALIEASAMSAHWAANSASERRAREGAVNARWCLLFKTDSSDDLGMDWAGGGQLHWTIERDALRRADFSRVWLNMDFL